MSTVPERQNYLEGPTMIKALNDFLFGLFFGMGFAIASAVLAFIASLISRGAQ